MRRGAGKAAALTAVIAVAAAISGCTSTSSPSVTATASASTHVLWWDISTQTGAHAAIAALVAGFEQQHPSVTVDVVTIPVDQARGRFDTAAQTTSGAPDVVTLDSGWIADFASRGYLARLDNTPALDPVDDQFTNLVPTATYDGRVVALTRSADGPALLYNAAVLKAAGVAVPKTWAELAADRLRLTAQGVQTLYAPANSDGLLPWIRRGRQPARPQRKDDQRQLRRRRRRPVRTRRPRSDGGRRGRLLTRVGRRHEDRIPPGPSRDDRR